MTDHILNVEKMKTVPMLIPIEHVMRDKAGVGKTTLLLTVTCPTTLSIY